MQQREQHEQQEQHEQRRTSAPDSPDAGSLEQERVLSLTYDNLRWLLVLLPAFLFLVTTLTAVLEGGLETSISAYYGGPVRDVFVGVLIAVAVCLVAYQGSTVLEDYNLNGAGFYAAFVALVPTGLEGILADLREGLVLSPDGVTPEQYVWSLRISLTLVLVLCAGLLVHELRTTERMRRLVRGNRLNLAFVAATGGTLMAFLALSMWQLWTPPAGEVTLEGLRIAGRQVRIHDLAAIFLISALVVAVASHAWPQLTARQESRRVRPLDMAVRRRYQVIVGLMLVGPLVAWGLARVFAPGHLVIFLEWWEILLFCAFWALETRRIVRARATSPAAP
ncbi:hypothetical protein [Ornithinimicrobium panacihumi]|uniref:hypothetical protein n=1 Tax=Ornithinimicrobium panacihumi TaxID=2008449 RepID=UPI003F8B19C2